MYQSYPEQNIEKPKQKRRSKGSLKDSAIAALLAPTTDPIILAKKRAASRLGNAVKQSKADMRVTVERANNPAAIIEMPTTSRRVTALRRSKLLAAEALVEAIHTIANIVRNAQHDKDKITAARLLADISGVTKLTEDSDPSDLRDYSADEIRRMISASVAREAALLEQSTHEGECTPPHPPLLNTSD